MKFRELREAQEVIAGTNCGNCLYGSSEQEPVSKSDLNPQGGLISENPKELKLAQAADLITLPGEATVSTKFYCTHPKLRQYVTRRQCCIHWDATGVYRAFGEKAID